jgi:DNA-directed RNA polymerase subunit H (RpoH/RPB5)
MHILQPKHTKLSESEIEKLLAELNISTAQLPKIKITDIALPEKSEIGDIVKIERNIEGKKTFFYRVVAV